MEPHQTRSLAHIRAYVQGLDLGNMESSGRWSVGQNLAHLADAIELTIEAPAGWAWSRRITRTPVRWRVLLFGIPKGVKIPQAVSERLTPPVAPVASEERDRLLRAIDALIEREGAFPPHPILGPLTKSEWSRFHAQHCKLHLRFFKMTG